MAQALGVVINPWTQRRRRAAELAERWPFATELLGFYAALLEVQEAVWARARIDVPERADVISYAGEHALRHIIDVTTAKGPTRLAGLAAEIFHEFDFVQQGQRWLGNDALEPVARYLVRASVGPVLEAIGLSAGGGATDGAYDERHCPSCGGLPQLSYFATSAEDLVTPQRFLECERCATSWTYPRMTCAACGETKTDFLPIFGEQGTLQADLAGRVIRKHGSQTDENPTQPSAEGAPRFRHVRIDACRACAHYLLTVDLGRDAHAVPVVDELAAVPLDLYAKELGMTKIVPNLMGF